MRKRRKWEKEDDLSDQLSEEQEIVEAKKRKYEDHRQREFLERFVEKKREREKQIKQAEIQHADKGLFSEWNSWFVQFSYETIQTE